MGKNQRLKVHRQWLPGRSLCSIRSNRKWCKRRGSSLECQNCFFVYPIIDSNLKNLQDIERQVRELKQQGATDETIYKEYESGTKTNRAELDKLLNIVQSGDTIIATEVSRFTRSTLQLCEIIEFVKKNHIKLVLGTFEVDCSKELDPMTEGMLKMMGVFAELERNMISQRVKSGMENAKAKGKAIGRPVTTTDNIPSIFYHYYPQYKNKKINKSELARLCSLSLPTVYKYLKIIEEQD